ncbi:hypothetical protein Sste5346_002399 [Sporothrix stenoceras]|uniref:DUF3500 domain-containing protein n=1 Tax=Sporothrix stenoceras TaxID=5173 RepID=A0ABR3ZKJ6_9PEZI
MASSTPPSPYRKWLCTDAPQYVHLKTATAVSHTEHLFSNVPLVTKINKWWDELWKASFKGITSNGNVIPNLYPKTDHGIPIVEIVQAANGVIAAATEEERKRLLLAVDAPERRAWSNPEIYVHRFGVRLDESSENVQQAVLHVLKTTLSERGYKKAVNATLINHFLGTLHNAPAVLNRWSYNFMIFGQPSQTDDWSFSLYGHHLCLNIAILRGSQIVLTPTFTGAEPNVIDSGPWTGTRILVEEERLGLAFMQQLGPERQKAAQLFTDIDGPNFATEFAAIFPTCPSGCRWNPADQRQICGAFQDNRIVPYEGACLAGINKPLQDLLLKLVEEFVLYLPDEARRERLQQVASHMSETYFCWIGGFGDEDAFYYRIQSPVIICEFDHHSGVFLTNDKPQKFHIHTVVRSPNGGDYGHALRSS